MRFPKLVLSVAATVALAAPAWSQDSAQQRGLFGAPEIAAQQAQVRALLEQIVRQRPVQAESAAREMVRRLQLEQQTLDSLRARSLDQYWQEVAQLTVQREMLAHQADSLRQQLMAQMFGTEAQARALQRDYRRIMDATTVQGQPLVIVDGVPIKDGVPITGVPTNAGPITVRADSARVRALRQQLQVVLERHLAAEDSLRSLEIADVERRLAQVRAETARRRRDRAALVRQMVDEVLRDALRPD